MALLEGIRITVYRKIGVGDDVEYNYVASVLTDENGNYSLSGLSAGTYRLKIADPNGAWLTEYFDGKESLDLANDIVLTAAQTVVGKDAVLGASAYIEGTISDV